MHHGRDTEEYGSAMRNLEGACGELDTLRRKGNFFPWTLKRIDDESDGVCAALRKIRAYVDDLRAENEAMREELGSTLEKHDHEGMPKSGPVMELSERTGQCAADLAKKPVADLMDELVSEGIRANKREVRENAREVRAAADEGHECNACQGKS